MTTNRAWTAWIAAFALAALAASASPGCGDSVGPRPDVDDAQDIETEWEVPITCGNSTVEDPEECDDGNEIDTDDCIDCRNAVCGDGFEQANIEECDDGNDIDIDGCVRGCLDAECGDRHVQEGVEECDAGPDRSDTMPDACRMNCRLPWCGDGVVDTGEPCDPGIDPVGCRVDCVPVRCGDGIVDPGELCDDGNPVNTDACLDNCMPATCGDGHTWTGEEECDGDPPRTCTTTCFSEGTQACLGSCTWEIDCVPPVEACNGLDEDCVDGPDNGFTCAVGAPVSCTTPCDSVGTGLCTAACGIPDAADCTPPIDICNGRDDDCVAGPDNGFTCAAGSMVGCATTCSSPGTGLCTAACEIPAPADCTPPMEVCNALDDDCVLGADNGFPCIRGAAAVPCTTTCISTGAGTCTADCQIPTGAACAPPTEICNGIDEDCVGGPDNTFPCVQGRPTPCTTTCGTTGTGTCTAACQIPIPTACTPPDEACDGIDNDCDTLTDEGLPCSIGAPVSCTTTCGSTGNGFCTALCEIPTGAACTPPAEVCNGRDDDCVAGCDNGWACCRGASVSCTTTCASTGTGACTAGCAIPAPAACTPPAEVCNGLDDDCVLGCDNGFPCCRDATVPCTTVCGSTGSGICSPTCAVPTAAACTPPAEVCNGIDDDCVGGADNGFPCVLNQTRPCTVGTCTGTETCVGPTCTWGACSFGSPPTNDTCGGSIPEVSGGGTFTGTTCAAVNNYTASCGGAAASPDVVFRLTLAARSFVVVDTVGSNFDAVLHLHRSAACDGSGATEVACDDNGAGGTPGQARIMNAFDAGTYWVILDGAFAGSRGVYALNVFVTPAPANDACAGAIDISAGGSFTGSTSFAGDDHMPSCIGTLGGADVFYTFTLAAQSVVYLDTVDGRAWDTVLQVRSGTCTGTSVGCNNNDCSTLRSRYYGVLAAGTYFVVVDAPDAASRGDFTLFAQIVPTAPCGPPVPMAMPFNASYWPWLEAADGDNLTPSCQANDSVEEVWYIPACGGRTVTITSCNGAGGIANTILHLRIGSCSAADAACRDDDGATCSVSGVRSTISAAIPKGLSFFVADAFNNATGWYRVDVTGL